MHHIRTLDEEIIQNKTLERRNEELLKLLDAWQTKGQNRRPAFIKSLNIHEVENLIIRFYQLYKIPVSLYDEDGKLLFSIGWKNILQKFQKDNFKEWSNCMLPVRPIDGRNPDINSYSFRCCYNVNAVAVPVMVHGELLGTLVINQFLYNDDVSTPVQVMETAYELGLDIEMYRKVLDELPVYSHDEIEKLTEHFVLFSEMISFIASHNVQLQEHQNITQEKNEICRIFREKLDDQSFLIKSIYQFMLQQNQEIEMLKSELHMLRRKSRNEMKEKSLVEEGQPG